MNTSTTSVNITAEILKPRVDWTKSGYLFVENCLENTERLSEETSDVSTLLYFAMVALGRFTRGTPAVNDFVSLFESLGLSECSERVGKSSYKEEDLAFYWSSTTPLGHYFYPSIKEPSRIYQTCNKPRRVNKQIMSDIWEKEPFFEIDKIPECLAERSWNLYELEDVTIIYDTAEFAVLDSLGRPVLPLCSPNYQHVYFTQMFKNFASDFAEAEGNNFVVLDKAVMIQDRIRAPNYCHWLLDHLPRLRHLSTDQNIILYNFAPFMKNMLASMGIDGKRVFELKERAVFRVNSLTIESSMAKHFYHPCQDMNSELVEFLRTSLSNKDVDNAQHVTHPYIYLSRNKFDRRRISNEPELLTCIENYNIKTIYPEELSLEEQVAVFKNASVIVSPHGASLANIVFCEDVKIIELFNQNYGTPTFYIMASLLGFEYQHILALNPMLSDSDKLEVGGTQLQKEDMEVDIDKLDHCLKTIFSKDSMVNK